MEIINKNIPKELPVISLEISSYREAADLKHVLELGMRDLKIVPSTAQDVYRDLIVYINENRPKNKKQVKADIWRPISLEYVLQVVAEVFDVTAEMIKSKVRTKHVSIARQAYFYIARERTDHSIKSIAAHVGNDHTTALYGCKNIANDLEIEFDPIKAKVSRVFYLIDQVEVSYEQETQVS